MSNKIEKSFFNITLKLTSSWSYIRLPKILTNVSHAKLRYLRYVTSTSTGQHLRVSIDNLNTNGIFYDGTNNLEYFRSLAIPNASNATIIYTNNQDGLFDTELQEPVTINQLEIKIFLDEVLDTSINSGNPLFIELGFYFEK